MSARVNSVFLALGPATIFLGLILIAPAKVALPDDTSTVLGDERSETGLTTHVVRSAASEPSAAELNHASHLAAHVIAQVADARFAIELRQPDKAVAALQKARRLAELLRVLLPKTQVRTTVRDRNGKTVYQDIRDVQDERIAVMDSMVRMEIVEPVREALRSEDEKNTDMSVRHTRMFLQLGFAERRLAEAERLLEERPDQADRSLRLLLVNGVEFENVAQHRSLADARDSLWSAQWAASNEDFAEARAHLVAAQEALVQYGQKLQPAEREQAKVLRAEIDSLAEILGGDGNRKPVVPRIQNALGKVRRWFDLHHPMHYDDDTTEENE